MPEGQGRLRDLVLTQPICLASTAFGISLPTLTFLRCCQTDPGGTSDRAWLCPPPWIALPAQILAQPIVRRELERVRAVHCSQRYHQAPPHPPVPETSLLPSWYPLGLTKINGFNRAEATVGQKAAEQQRDWEAMHVSQPGKQQPWKRAGEPTDGEEQMEYK